MRTLALLLALGRLASAEVWPELDEYVDACSWIMKAETRSVEDGKVILRARESWKGSRPFAEKVHYVARQGEHGVQVVPGQEIVFFFTEGRRHSTAFPIREGRVIYAETSESPREFTLAEFKRAILQRTSPPGLYPFAISACAKYRLRIVNMERRVEDGRPDAVGIQFDLEEIALHDPAEARSWKPTEILYEMHDPLALARTAEGEDLSTAPHSPYWGIRTGRLAVHNFEVPREVERLKKLALEPELVHITESDQLVFENLGLGESDLLHCGAFELSVMGRPDRVSVGCAAHAVYEADHRAFRERFPIRALHHRWAIGALEVIDAEGKKLQERGGGGSGGASGSDFARQDGAPVAYPVTVRLRMPKTFQRERVRFEFDDLRLWRLWTAGGTELVYRIGTRIRAAILEVIRKRLDGGANFELQLAGEDRFVLRIATRDPMKLNRIKSLLESPGKLEFRITIEPAPEELWDRFQASGERTIEGRRWYPVTGDTVQAERTKCDTAGKRWMLVALDDHNITGADLERIEHRRSALGPSWEVCFEVRQPRREAMSRLTAVEGKYLAMILDGEVQSAPILRDTLTDRVQIDANFTEDEARALASILRAGALDVRPVLVSERPTGP